MSQKITGNGIRNAILEVIEELKDTKSSLQSGSVLQRVEKKISVTHNDIETQQAILTTWQDFFRAGYLAWGYDLSNPNPPFCHLTDKGRRILRHLSRDPGNPDGYMHYLESNTKISSVTKSYLIEAIETYNSGLHKASAVMIGCATESIILELGENLDIKMSFLSKPVNKDLRDWRVKRILLGIEAVFDGEKKNMPVKLFESFKANWSAFTQQIRKIRNDAGHPASLEEITEENVHASLLVFPELAKLADELNHWIEANLK